MAVVKQPQSASFGLKLNIGVNTAGNPLYKLIRFSNVKPSATDEDIYAVAAALAGLQKHQLSSIQRIDTANLVTQ